MQSNNTPGELTPTRKQEEKAKKLGVTVEVYKELKKEANKIGLDAEGYFILKQKAKEQGLAVTEYLKLESEQSNQETELKAKKLGITVEQFWEHRDLAESKLEGVFLDCDILDSHKCKHASGRPCIHNASMKSKPLLNVPVLSEQLLKLANEVINERYLLLLGEPEQAKDFAAYLHKKRRKQKMLANKDPLVPALDTDTEMGKRMVSANFEEIECCGCIPTDILIEGTVAEPKLIVQQTAFFDHSKVGGRTVPIPRTDNIYTLFMSNADLSESKPIDQFTYAIHCCLKKLYDYDSLEKTNGFLFLTTRTEKEKIYKPLLKEFKILDLEPEKQGETAAISQGKPKKDFVPFPKPEGTQWQDIKIGFIDNENVSINIKGKTVRKNYAEMGFTDKRTCKPVKSWKILLDLKEKNPLTFESIKKEETEKAIQDLRKRLKEYFGIQDDPIIFKHGYIPEFEVFEAESQSRSVYAFSYNDVFDDKQND